MWFGVSILLRNSDAASGEADLWEESIVLVVASNSDEARRIATSRGMDMENEYTAATGRKLRWVFDSVLAVFELLEEAPVTGAVVFSRHLLPAEVQMLKKPIE